MASSIKQITVENLFGQYSYHLPTDDFAGDISRLFMLYGDNGSGKTTVLRVLFHLLSYQMKAGHKTVIARTPFSSFAVVLNDSTRISAERPNGNIIGDYRLCVTRPEEGEVSVDLTIDSDGAIQGHDDTLPPVLDAIESLGLNLYMLQDDRRLRGESSDSDETIYIDPDMRRLSAYRHARNIQWHVDYRGNWEPEHRDDPRLLVHSTIRRFEIWIRRHALTGSSTGQANTDSIYKDVLERIVRLPTGSSKDDVVSLDDLRERVDDLGKRVTAYSRYGLVPEFDSDALDDILERALPHNNNAVYEVLSPYVDGLSARLDALEDAQQIIDNLITSINSFFLHKTVEFDVRGGLNVLLETGSRLDPALLSSGERQVLILLCNCVTAPPKSIFVVDEPELSLNIKWQRQLTKALLACTQHSRVQFLLATHSFELLAGHKESVVTLESQSK